MICLKHCTVAQVQKRYTLAITLVQAVVTEVLPITNGGLLVIKKLKYLENREFTILFAGAVLAGTGYNELLNRVKEEKYSY